MFIISNCHKVKFALNLHTIFILLFLKKYELKYFKRIFKNAFISWSFFTQRDDNKQQSKKDYLSITKSHKEFYLVSEVIKTSKELLKSTLLKNHEKVKKTAKRLKSIKHVWDLKWAFKIQ